MGVVSPGKGMVRVKSKLVKRTRTFQDYEAGVGSG